MLVPQEVGLLRVVALGPVLQVEILQLQDPPIGPIGPELYRKPDTVGALVLREGVLAEEKEVVVGGVLEELDSMHGLEFLLDAFDGV